MNVGETLHFAPPVYARVRVDYLTAGVEEFLDATVLTIDRALVICTSNERIIVPFENLAVARCLEAKQ